MSPPKLSDFPAEESPVNHYWTNVCEFASPIDSRNTLVDGVTPRDDSLLANREILSSSFGIEIPG
ncbi:hypothetical protein KOR42_24840 [Thalassoglobus neptunius]|uniref:Uncharacterized protein n=1 Tax=Thalassoglobus neptunius TaxID=1938619 RepID=A0A5C5XA90_9PLAN|nr:hypothetical protein KOR42_24840 [Thalassoglobus neptunius]